MKPKAKELRTTNVLKEGTAKRVQQNGTIVLKTTVIAIPAQRTNGTHRTRCLIGLCALPIADTPSLSNTVLGTANAVEVR